MYIANHRSVAGVLEQILLLSSMVGAAAKGESLVERLEARIDAARAAAEKLPVRPRVYFEEWDEPMISAIRWVSEIVGIAGGDDVFAELSVEPAGRDRIIADANEVIRRDPQLIVGSWCGKRFRPGRSPRVRAGTASTRCAPGGCTRSSRPRSCSPVPRR